MHLPPRYMTLPPVLHSAWCGLALAEQAGGFAPPLMAPTTCGRQPFFLSFLALTSDDRSGMPPVELRFRGKGGRARPRLARDYYRVILGCGPCGYHCYY